MITLSAGGYEAGVSPEAGAALIFLRHDGRDLLRPAPSIDAVMVDPRVAASFACVPYFGRLYGGLDFGGAHWDQAPTLPACDSEHALHGEGWVSSWSITEERAATLSCCLLHRESPGRFPFAFEATQKFELGATGLALVLSITNIGPKRMPVGLGLHPYFPRADKIKIRFVARELWTPQAYGGGLSGPIPKPLDFSIGARLPGADIDHTFIGFDGVVMVSDGRYRCSLTSDTPNLHVFAPAGANFFCLEPVSHRPGDLGGCALEPGQSLRHSMTIVAG